MDFQTQRALKTFVYVDGFNLYYGLKNAARSWLNESYKWLNVHKFVASLLSNKYQISRIKYFTAQVDKRPQDSELPIRQALYYRALKTIQ